MTIALFGNTYKRQTLNEVEHLLALLKEKDIRVLLSQELRHEMNLVSDYEPFTRETQEEVAFAISVGGDGTFLTTAAEVVEKDIPILGINCGHLGFLTAATTEDVDAVVDRVLKGDYVISERSMLQVSTIGGGHVMMPYALNEVAVLKQELSSMISVETTLDGEHLHTYKADGLVVSTPTGSTAYNLSAGGPLISPYVSALALTPIATHSLYVRPLIIPDDRKIEMKIHSRSGSYLISVDGRSQALKEEVSLVVERAPYTVKLMMLPDRGFIETLKQKLLWGQTNIH